MKKIISILLATVMIFASMASVSAASTLSLIHISLEKDMYDDGNSLFSDFLGSEDENFLVIENQEFVEELFSVLTQEEQNFLTQRFFVEKTQTQIANEKGISKMQVSRYEKRLLEKIRLRYEQKERERCV